jgi:hypothetical protein
VRISISSPTGTWVPAALFVLDSPGTFFPMKTIVRWSMPFAFGFLTFLHLGHMRGSTMFRGEKFHSKSYRSSSASVKNQA